VELEGMNMVDKHSLKERPKVENMNMIEERPSKQRLEVEVTMAEVDVEVIEREHGGCGVGEALDLQWSGEVSTNSSGTKDWEVGSGGVLRRSHQVCKSKF
jgi:hypothetical protein